MNQRQQTRMIKFLFSFFLFGLTIPVSGVEKTQLYWYRSLLPEIKTEVKPLLQTAWGQNAPYNLLCPQAPGSSVHCKTGCVATAMAQVMKFYAYPEAGKGQISYTYNGDDGRPYAVEVHFDKHQYDWTKMENVYRPLSSYPEEKRMVVAQLMADCGAAVKMQYGKWDSGAFEMDIAPAMKTYFGYDDEAVYMSSMLHEIDDSTWFTTLFKELSAGRPVIYGGITASYLAHCFVVDGYDSEGKVHVVYGLGEYEDGFVLLKEIAFKYGQSMIVRLHPPKTSTKVERAVQEKPSAQQQIFAIDGTRSACLHRGINVVRDENKRVRKVLVK